MVVTNKTTDQIMQNQSKSGDLHSTFEHVANMSAGMRFRRAVEEERPLQIVGTINANHALLAQKAGFRSIYVSGVE